MVSDVKQVGISAKIIDEIIEIAKKYNVEKVILFGSRARGTYQTASDIDLAVIGGDKLGFRFSINEETSTLLQFDVVDLENNIQDKLRDSIEREGIILYEKI